jgi:hypothetical protein
LIQDITSEKGNKNLESKNILKEVYSKSDIKFSLFIQGVFNLKQEFVLPSEEVNSI